MFINTPGGGRGEGGEEIGARGVFFGSGRGGGG